MFEIDVCCLQMSGNSFTFNDGVYRKLSLSTIKLHLSKKNISLAKGDNKFMGWQKKGLQSHLVSLGDPKITGLTATQGGKDGLVAACTYFDQCLDHLGNHISSQVGLVVHAPSSFPEEYKIHSATALLKLAKGGSTIPNVPAVLIECRICKHNIQVPFSQLAFEPAHGCACGRPTPIPQRSLFWAVDMSITTPVSRRCHTQARDGA